MLTTLVTALALTGAGDYVATHAWDVTSAEITADDDGVEVLAFDDDGELVGTLIVAANLGEDPSEPLLRLDASFADGYASLPIYADNLEASAPAQRHLTTDLDPETASARIEAMLAFIDEERGLTTDGMRGPTRRQCQVMFGTAAVVCGVGAITANPGIILACLANETNVVCNCAKYIPIKICDGN